MTIMGMDPEGVAIRHFADHTHHPTRLGRRPAMNIGGLPQDHECQHRDHEHRFHIGFRQSYQSFKTRQILTKALTTR
jgi:hypothetical protein